MRRVAPFVLRHVIWPMPVVFAAVIGESACSDANQKIIGGDPQFDAGIDPQIVDAQAEAVCIPSDAADQTWTSLYQSFFGPSGIGQCGDSTRTGTATTSCHHDGTGQGALASGFICGDTQDSCYQGITSPQAQFIGTPVVAACNPSGSYVTHVLRQEAGTFGMPFYPETVVFSQTDMDRIRGWISAGAPNN